MYNMTKLKREKNVRGSGLQWSVMVVDINCQKMRQQMEASFMTGKRIGALTADSDCIDCEVWPMLLVSV